MNLRVNTDMLYDQLSEETIALRCPGYDTAQAIIDALTSDFNDPFETKVSPATDDASSTVEAYVLTIRKPWFSRDNGWFTTDPATEVHPYSEFTAE